MGGGGGGLSIAIGAIAAWFPLGPRESYQPWYHASPAYCNRVNVTNIYTTNVTEIHNTYINKTVNVYNTTNVTNVTYVNRTVATVVVPQSALASGRPIAQAQRIQLTPQVRAQLSAAPIIPHPMVTPATAIVAVKAPPRAVPPVQARPVVETRQGFERAGAPGTPVRAPQPTVAVNRPGPARTRVDPAGKPRCLPATAPGAGHCSSTQRGSSAQRAPAPIAHPIPAAQVPANRPASQIAPVRPPVISQPAIEHPAQVAQPEPGRGMRPNRLLPRSLLRPSSSGRRRGRPTSRAR